ncbi:MAG TPA: hypothetical protein PKM63_00175 [Panacibacter sp.]|nr:hypothetical protein [Panacibacter sp.]HNP42665.1 hypothetical protein [Panacibacter sp.]
MPVLFFPLISSLTVIAQGNLMITPRRVVFEGADKTQELNLANTGSDTARYLISLIEIRMKEDGTFEKIDVPDSGQHFASSFVRFFPKSVVLAPGEAQAVKVQVVKTGELNPGEYRSHIYFRAVPTETPLGNDAEKPASAISVRLTPVFGISIPVIIRVGEPQTEVSISNLYLENISDTVKAVHMVFNRNGNISTYGNVRIDYIPDQGKKTQVCEVKGIAVYTPTAKRMLRVNLVNTGSVDLHKGKLHVSYYTESGNKSSVMAEADLLLL